MAKSTNSSLLHKRKLNNPNFKVNTSFSNCNSNPNSSLNFVNNFNINHSSNNNRSSTNNHSTILVNYRSKYHNWVYNNRVFPLYAKLSMESRN